MTNVLIAILYGCLTVWVFWGFVSHVYYLILPRQELFFTPFETPNSDLNKYAPEFLSTELESLQADATRAPIGYGPLEVPVLSALPRMAQENTGSNLKRLENLQLKIKDVDLTGFLNSFTTFVSLPTYQIRGHINDFPDTLEGTCELFYGEKRQGIWRGTITKRTTTDAAGAALTKKDLTPLLDDLFFQMIFDFLTKPEFRGWGVKITQADEVPHTWQELQAYTHGMAALGRYEMTHDHMALEEAQKRLQTLETLAPGNKFGLYYYGIVLTENRKEAEAVAVFQQLERLPNLDVPLKFEATLNESTSRLKLYRFSEAEKAIQVLKALIKSVEEQLKVTDSGSSEFSYLTKLLALCYGELAHTEATILSFQTEDALTEVGDVNKYYSEMTTHLDKADDLSNSVGSHWTSEAERMDVLARIANARGYSAFRYAQRLPPSDGKRFSDLCEQALSRLEQADRDRPSRYGVLQNIAMIYADSRFDPTGDSLEKAEALFERTKLLVPTDYYQYQQLAKIQRRRLELGGTVSQKAEWIEKGRKNALEALSFRPYDRQSSWFLAQFAIDSWEIDKSPNGDKNGMQALRNLAYAAAAWPQNPEIATRYSKFAQEFAEERASAPEILIECGTSLMILENTMEIGSVQQQEMLKRAIEYFEAVKAIVGEAADGKAVRDRADILAKQAHSRLGKLRLAHAGIYSGHF
jgi:hypothetical protein